jgi:hypothetical protein
MAALFGLAMLGQVACAGFVDCSGPPPEPEVAAEAVDEPVVVVPDCGLPICGPLGARLYCIEGYESRHNGSAVNFSSGAKGWLQWLPGTARRWEVVIGDRQSEWLAAARIASLGEAFFRSQWVPLQRHLC